MMCGSVLKHGERRVYDLYCNSKTGGEGEGCIVCTPVLKQGKRGMGVY